MASRKVGAQMTEKTLLGRLKSATSRRSEISNKYYSPAPVRCRRRLSCF